MDRRRKVGAFKVSITQRNLVCGPELARRTKKSDPGKIALMQQMVWMTGLLNVTTFSKQKTTATRVRSSVAFLICQGQ
jgi:hypothetical protein